MKKPVFRNFHFFPKLRNENKKRFYPPFWTYKRDFSLVIIRQKNFRFAIFRFDKICEMNYTVSEVKK